MKTCVFAGTFDPFTVGHADTVEKCLKIFDGVIVAVAENTQKKTRYTASEREEMISSVYHEDPRVKVLVWNGAIVDLLKQEETPFYVRGIRSGVDCEYETADFYANRDLCAEMVTLYLPAEREHLHVSSMLVKNCLHFGKPFQDYVPPAVYDYLVGKEGLHV